MNKSKLNTFVLFAHTQKPQLFLNSEWFSKVLCQKTFREFQHMQNDHKIKLRSGILVEKSFEAM